MHLSNLHDLGSILVIVGASLLVLAIVVAGAGRKEASETETTGTVLPFKSKKDRVPFVPTRK